jgi:PAS domain S-box-containing protein
MSEALFCSLPRRHGEEVSIPHGRLVCACGFIVASAGVVALLGWALGFLFLASLGSDRIPMAPSTALLFVLYGVATLLRARSPLHRGAYWLGVVVNGAGVLVVLWLYRLSYQGVFLEAERLGFTAVGASGGASIGHMSPLTALGFVLASLSYLTSLPPVSNQPRLVPIGYCLAGLLLAASSALLLAYLYGAPLLYDSSVVPPAATTSLAFAALGIALVALAGPQAWPSSEPDAAPTRPALVLVLLLLLLAVGIITVGHLYFRSHATHYRAEVERELSSVARLKAAALAQYRRERLGDGSILFRNATVSSLLQSVLDNPADGKAEAELWNWLGKVQAHYEYDRVFVLDAQGAVRMSVPEATGPIAAVIARGAAEALRSREMALQDFYRDEHDQRIHLAVLIPILGGSDGSRALGVIVLRTDPKTYLHSLTSRWPGLTQTAETLLVRRDGNDVLRLDDLSFGRKSALALYSPPQAHGASAVKSALGREGIVEGMDYRGVAVIADLRAIPDSPWLLVIRMDASEVNTPLRERMWMTVGFVALLLIGAGAGVGSIWRQQHARFYWERQQARETLAERAQELSLEKSFIETVVRGLPGIFYMYALDGGGRMERWNDNLRTVSGYEDDEIRQLSALEFFSEEDRPRVAEAMGEVVRKGSATIEASLVTRQGRSVPFLFSGIRFDAHGRSHILGFGIDISERRRAERELALRGAALAAAANAIVITDQDGKIVWVNPAFTRVTGYASQEAVGNTPRLLKSGAHDRSFYEHLWKTIGSGQVWSGEIINRRKDGTLYTEEQTITPVPDKNHFIAIKQDITARKQAEQDLRQALAKAEESDRVKSAFLANISHEVRTPLNVISGFTSLVEDHLREIDDHSQDELFESLHQSNKRLLDTMHGLLDLASVETGAFSANPTGIELFSFVREKIDGFTPAARRKGLSLGLEAEERGAEVRFDPYCLTRIVENLLDNAIKFTERGGVTVSIHRDEGSALCLSVRDTGVGITPSYAPHLFDRFSQEESGYTRNFEGAGIGLALVKRYVELNQAEISFQSQKGAGTIFTIRFASGPGTVDRGLASAAVMPKPVVLVVEDDDPTQDLLTVALRHDFDLLHAVSAQEARARLAAHPEVAVVLMDLSLNGNEDGLALTRWMRSERRWRDVPVIATTAHAMEHDRENALEAGCSEYLAKPISPVELRSTIGRVLARVTETGRSSPPTALSG